MWFPTNTQKKIEAQMALIEECFIKYYGEKYRDKISKKFKEFFFIVVHHSLFSEELFFSDKSLKVLALCSIESHTKKEILQMISPPKRNLCLGGILLVLHQVVLKKNMRSRNHHEGSLGYAESIV